MKINKFKILNIISILTTIVLLTGCNKIEEGINFKSKVGFEIEIKNWFNNQNQITNQFRKQKLKSLEENLNFAFSWEEVYKKKKVIVIPIKESFKFKNNFNKNTTNYFVGFKNIKDEIVFSLIIQIRDDINKTKVIINQGDILKIYNSEPINKQINVRFITIFDNYLFEKEFSQNKMIFHKDLDSKISNPSTNSVINNLEISGCID